MNDGVLMSTSDLLTMLFCHVDVADTYRTFGGHYVVSLDDDAINGVNHDRGTPVIIGGTSGCHNDGGGWVSV